MAGASLLCPVINYWWPSFPANLSKEGFSSQLPEDQWTQRVAHHLPWLTYWWNTQKLFPALSILSGRHEILSSQDLEIIRSSQRPVDQVMSLFLLVDFPIPLSHLFKELGGTTFYNVTKNDAKEKTRSPQESLSLLRKSCSWHFSSCSRMSEVSLTDFKNLAQQSYKHRKKMIDKNVR